MRDHAWRDVTDRRDLKGHRIESRFWKCSRCGCWIISKSVPVRSGGRLVVDYGRRGWKGMPSANCDEEILKSVQEA